MNEEQLAEIEARCEAATKGPWSVYVCGIRSLGYDVDGPEEGNRGQFERQEDAEFIARAREDVPALIAEVRRLRESK